MRLAHVALLATLAALTECTPSPAEIKQYLSTHLSKGSGVYLPSDQNFTVGVTQRWDRYNAPTYNVVVKPALASDVQIVVQYASQNNLSFLGTGGGHGYTTTLGKLQNGIDIDLGNFNGVSISTTANTMTIGGSVRFANITGPLQTAKKEFPVGACSCIGLLGATLGGGVGSYGSMYGVISDSLLSVEMVTGAGNLITASSTQNSDLFWAMKGAGHNFGIVTSATYRIYDATNSGQAVVADMIFPASVNGSIWNIMAAQVGKQPKQLTYQIGAAYNSTIKATLLIVNIIYVGPMSSAAAYYQPLLDLKPVTQYVRNVAYKDIQDSALFGAPAMGCVKGRQYAEYGVNLYKMDVPNLIDSFNFFSQSVVSNSALQAVTLAITQFSQYGYHLYNASTSAFPFRDLVTLVELDGLIPTTSATQAVESFGVALRTRYQRASGASSTQVYVNYAHGDEGPVAWYGSANQAQLASLKRTYDPKSLFSFYCAIPTQPTGYGRSWIT